MNTATYQNISPLEVALGAFYNLSKKAQKEFLRVIAEQNLAASDALQAEIEKGREQIRNGECVVLATDADFDEYFKTVS